MKTHMIFGAGVLLLIMSVGIGIIKSNERVVGTHNNNYIDFNDSDKTQNSTNATWFAPEFHNPEVDEVIWCYSWSEMIIEQNDKRSARIKCGGRVVNDDYKPSYNMEKK